MWDKFQIYKSTPQNPRGKKKSMFYRDHGQTLDKYLDLQIVALRDENIAPTH